MSSAAFSFPVSLFFPPVLPFGLDHVRERVRRHARQGVPNELLEERVHLPRPKAPLNFLREESIEEDLPSTLGASSVMYFFFASEMSNWSKCAMGAR